MANGSTGWCHSTYLPRGAWDLEEVQRHSAAKLLIARINAAGPVTRPGARNGDAVAKICHRLDGIPLALELAATSASVIGVEELADPLDDQLRLLVDGRRTAPPRHRTLRATLDWSNELLSELERTVMRRLAAFAGNFTLEVTSAVATSRDVNVADVVRCLTGLVRKSIVLPESDGTTPRYRILEAMRVYAMDRLSEGGEGG